MAKNYKLKIPSIPLRKHWKLLILHIIQKLKKEVFSFNQGCIASLSASGMDFYMESIKAPGIGVEAYFSLITLDFFKVF